MDAPPVQYVKTRDGYDIAYSVAGTGPTVLVPPFIHSHVQLNWQNDLVIVRRSAILERLAEHFQVVTFDNRGQGLSSRGLPETLTLDQFDIDTEAVASQIEDSPFAFVACARAGHLAVRYAVRHPQRLAALVLISSQVSMQTLPSGLFDLLPTENWEFFLQTQLLPGLPPEDVRAGTEMLKQTATPDDYKISWRNWKQSDIGDLLPLLQVPTLVLHARDFPFVKSQEATLLASRIPGARLAIIDGYDIFGNAGQAVQVIREFLASLPARNGRDEALEKAPGPLSRRQVEILRLLASGKTNREIAESLVLSQRTVERHVEDIYAKIGARNRSEATAYALAHLGHD